MSGLRGAVAHHTVLRAIDRVATSRWDDAMRHAATTSGTRAERVEQVADAMSRELAAVGAATGGVAALPGVGTVASLATATADVGWTTTRACDLVLTIAAIHGHDHPSVDERRLWITAVLAFGDDAAQEVRHLAADAGGAAGAADAAAAGRLSGGSMAALNQGFGRTLLVRWALRRAATSLGKALPFGIGAAFGGAANWASTRTIARHADRMFTQLGAVTTTVDATPA